MQLYHGGLGRHQIGAIDLHFKVLPLCVGSGAEQRQGGEEAD